LLDAFFHFSIILYSKEIKKIYFMHIARISSQKQITIPAKIYRKLKLDIGDHIGITEEDGQIVLRPYMLVPKDQLWYWTEERQKKEREADEDIAAGRVSGPFSTAKEFMEDLKSTNT